MDCNTSKYLQYKQKYLEQKAGMRQIHIQITNKDKDYEISPKLKQLLDESQQPMLKDNTSNNTIHLLSVSQLTKSIVLKYISKANEMKSLGYQNKYPNKILINMFYEPSTRTSCSFQSAAIKLGCKVISLTDKFSSSEKGESIEDTIKTLNFYGDVIVLRHPDKGIIDKIKFSKIPIINAGNGSGEHPTQALLDVYTIYTELLKFKINLDSEKREKIVITFCGDLKNSRTIHSLIHILTLFPKIKFIYISPPSLGMPLEIINSIQHEQITMSSLEEAISITDILYVTRIQKERFSSEEEYISSMDNYEKYHINKKMMSYAKDEMIVMHPFPRLNEISTEVDNDPRAMYFTQIENGVYMRMAILDYILS